MSHIHHEQLLCKSPVSYVNERLEKEEVRVGLPGAWASVGSRPRVGNMWWSVSSKDPQTYMSPRNGPSLSASKNSFSHSGLKGHCERWHWPAWCRPSWSKYLPMPANFLSLFQSSANHCRCAHTLEIGWTDQEEEEEEEDQKSCSLFCTLLSWAALGPCFLPGFCHH